MTTYDEETRDMNEPVSEDSTELGSLDASLAVWDFSHS